MIFIHSLFRVVLVISLFLVTFCDCDGTEVEESLKMKPKPKYTEIQRGTITTTEIPEESEHLNYESEQEEDRPRIISNGRGGNYYSSQRADDEDENENEDKPDGKRYVEIRKLGAKNRAKTRITSTTTSPKLIIEEEEDEDENVRPNGCNQCRFYCKQCRGTEEVTSGGVWGCCNHNCCGGRCSCQKLK